MIKRRIWIVAGIVVLVVPALVALRLMAGESGEGQAATFARTPKPVREVPPSRPPSNRLHVRVPSGASAVLFVHSHQRAKLRTQPDGGRLVANLRPHTAFGSRTTLALVRIRGRWAQVITPDLPNGQLAWVKLDRRRLAYYLTYARVDVDLVARRLTLFDADKPVRSFSVSIGAPGTDTPVGHFAVTDTFLGLHDPSYGCCALALSAHQPYLPSGWMGGNRIAIHGTYDPLGEAISHGCVHAANPVVRYLVAHAPIGSPVDIHD